MMTRRAWWTISSRPCRAVKPSAVRTRVARERRGPQEVRKSILLPYTKSFPLSVASRHRTGVPSLLRDTNHRARIRVVNESLTHPLSAILVTQIVSHFWVTVISIGKMNLFWGGVISSFEIVTRVMTRYNSGERALHCWLRKTLIGPWACLTHKLGISYFEIWLYTCSGANQKLRKTLIGP